MQNVLTLHCIKIIASPIVYITRQQFRLFNLQVHYINSMKGRHLGKCNSFSCQELHEKVGTTSCPFVQYEAIARCQLA